MRYHDVQPDVGFDLADDMCVGTGRNTLYRRLELRKRFEEADYALANTRLLALLMDVRITRVEEVNLAVSEFLFTWLSRPRW